MGGLGTRLGLTMTNLVPRVLRLLGQRFGRLLATKPLTKEPQDSGYKIGASPPLREISKTNVVVLFRSEKVSKEFLADIESVREYERSKTAIFYTANPSVIGQG